MRFTKTSDVRQPIIACERELNPAVAFKTISRSCSMTTKRKASVHPDGQQTDVVDDAIERLDKLAESELAMARLFIDRGKTEIARRRLNEVIGRFEKTNAAEESRNLLKALNKG